MPSLVEIVLRPNDNGINYYIVSEKFTKIIQERRYLDYFWDDPNNFNSYKEMNDLIKYHATPVKFRGDLSSIKLEVGSFINKVLDKISCNIKTLYGYNVYYDSGETTFINHSNRTIDILFLMKNIKKDSNIIEFHQVGIYNKQLMESTCQMVKSIIIQFIQLTPNKR